LPSLTAIQVRGRGNAADALAESTLPERLTSLALDQATFSPGGLAALTTGSRLSRMRRLRLSNTSLLVHGAELLAAAPLDVLISLDLYGADLDADAIGRLVSSPRLAGLRELELRSNRTLGDSGAATLARSSRLPALKSLDLSYCQIGPAGAAALAASPHLAGLRHLRLTQNPLGDEGVCALADSPYLGELRDLELVGVGMSKEGLRALAHARGLGNLRRLHVYFNKFTETIPAVREFAEPSCLPRLLSLAVVNGQSHSPGALTALGRELVL
jgi:hypothetical protein